MKSLRTLTAVAAMALVVPLVGPATASSPVSLDSNNGPGFPGTDQVGEIEHVANIPWGGRGSDIEFASREVVKLSNGATGDPVCQTDATGACLTDANGQIIFQTEVRDFAVAGVYNKGAHVVDITDPRNPVVVGEGPCPITQNDIQVQGDLLLVASDGSGRCARPDGGSQSFSGTAVLDFSDPRNPTYLSRLQYSRGSHNHTFVPGKPIVYLSDSDVVSTVGNIPIWDVSDPANPVLKTEFQHLVHSPHDITFNADGTRAYVAAVSATYILNTEDPFNPTLISTIANEGISISHQSDPTPDGNYLLVSDELGGGAAGVSPGGPVHVYDIRNEAAPVKIGIVENSCVQETCHSASEGPVSTAHVFRINPDGYTMAIGWYRDGIFVIDYSDLIGGNAAGSGETAGVGARVIAGMRMEGANSWAAKMWQERHPGFVFANDVRGLDVFFVPELGPGFLGTGSIRGGHPATTAAGGVTEHEFATVGGCEDTPVSQGTDGWVISPISAELADGNHAINLAVHNGPAAALTLWFYDESCGLMSTSPTAPGSPILEGARHIVVNAETGAAVNFTASTSQLGG